MPQPIMLKKLKLNGSMNLQDLLELTHKKRYPFHHRGLDWKSRKSRDTGSNSQILPWSAEWSREKTKRVFPREHMPKNKRNGNYKRKTVAILKTHKVGLLIRSMWKLCPPQVLFVLWDSVHAFPLPEIPSTAYSPKCLFFLLPHKPCQDHSSL